MLNQNTCGKGSGHQALGPLAKQVEVGSRGATWPSGVREAA